MAPACNPSYWGGWGGRIELGRWRLQGAETAQLHSSLGNRPRLHLKKKVTNTWKKVFVHYISNTSLLTTTYNLYNSTTKTTELQNGETVEHTLLQEDMQMENRHTKRWSIPLSLRPSNLKPQWHTPSHTLARLRSRNIKGQVLARSERNHNP